MKKLLIIALALGVSACSDTQQKESRVYEIKDLTSDSSVYEAGIVKESRVYDVKDLTSDDLVYKDGMAKQEDVSSEKYQDRNVSSSRQSSFYNSNPNELPDHHEIYTVKKNDSLMKIAFSIYGDYDMWKSLKVINSQKISSDNTIFEGMTLSYKKPKEEFVQNKNGESYLIIRGDTLSSISRNAYKTSSHWTKIWENNKQLIKDPNKIFAGFTIYLPEIND